jgi:Activator of Hsp90 ATPase homolog 1-like protein
VVQAVDFVSDDPTHAGTMTMTWEVTAVDAGTRVDIRADDVPAGISAKDHAAGLASSLANLATYLEQYGNAHDRGAGLGRRRWPQRSRSRKAEETRRRRARQGALVRGTLSGWGAAHRGRVSAPSDSSNEWNHLRGCCCYNDLEPPCCSHDASHSLAQGMHPPHLTGCQHGRGTAARFSCLHATLKDQGLTRCPSSGSCVDVRTCQ